MGTCTTTVTSNNTVATYPEEATCSTSTKNTTLVIPKDKFSTTTPPIQKPITGSRFPLIALLAGCPDEYPMGRQEQYCGIDAKPITVTSTLNEEDTALIYDYIFNNLGLLMAINPNWVCDLNKINIILSSEEKIDSSYLGSYNDNTDGINLRVSPETLAILKDPTNEWFPYTQLHLQHTIFHEYGHYVSNNFAGIDKLSAFAEISFNKQKEYSNKQTPISFLVDNWQLDPDSQYEDFIGNDNAGDPKDGPYGSKNPAEDWAQTFSRAAMDILIDNKYIPNLVIVDHYEYSDIAIAKLAWMKNFMLQSL